MEVFTPAPGGGLRYWHVRRQWRPGRPWLVTARSRDELFEGEAAGWRASRELMVRVRTEIETTGRPQSLRGAGDRVPSD
ncbi:hypothetical protein R8Z50_31720 [Longispora sp. K20-0274]|uniref:hypothetical protein n=1 Tax=Longispora sp. K20-0274 TaxID=3088255 RepID=UPI00399A78D4